MQKKSAKNLANGFIPIPFVVLVVVIGTIITAAKIIENPHILGTSTFLAENGDGTGPAPAPGDGGGGGGGSAPAPQQAPSEPQQQQSQPSQPQQQSAPQPQSQPSQPQQNTQTTGSVPGSGQQQYQPKNAEEQKQYNQYMQQTPEQQKQQFQQYQQQGANQRNQQYQPGNPQPGNAQQNTQNTGPAGSGQGGPQGNNPQEQQKFQQLQQQWQQDASKFGFQIQAGSGSNQGQNPANFPKITGDFNVGAQGQGGNQQQININDGKTVINLGSLQAVRPDGTKFEIDKEAKEKIHAAIKLETGSEVSQNGDTFTVKRGDVSASTNLPISFNVATKTFTVQTGTGEKEIKVLPDQAVAKIKEANANFTANADSVKLAELNNEPVFEIPGESKQKLLGFIPVGIQQTSIVSAQDGNLVTTNQSVVSRILDTLSF